jgi:hypothetical protein
LYSPYLEAPEGAPIIFNYAVVEMSAPSCTLFHVVPSEKAYVAAFEKPSAT